jgi:hypothetical protein
LYANLCQRNTPPNLPIGFSYDTGNIGAWVKRGGPILGNSDRIAGISCRTAFQAPTNPDLEQLFDPNRPGRRLWPGNSFSPQMLCAPIPSPFFWRIGGKPQTRSLAR